MNRTIWMLALVACGGGASEQRDDTGSTGADTGGIPTALAFGNGVEAGSAYAEGQWKFLYETWGTEQGDAWPPAEWLVAIQTEQPEVFGDQFAAFGFVADPADDLPVGLERGTVDDTRVHETCALCHVAELPDGTLWLGAPNLELDIGAFRIAVNEAWVADGHAPLFTELELDKWAGLGPGRTSAESGDHPYLVPARFPPYFDLGARTAFNYMGTGQDLRTEAYFATYAFGAGNPNDEDAPAPFPTDDDILPMVEAMGTWTAPPGPAQDPDAVARGRQVFEDAQCISCHHDDPADDFVVKLDKDEGAPERLPGEAGFDRGTIKTSGTHRVLQDGDPDVDGGDGPDEGRLALIAFMGAKGLLSLPTDGYMTANLRGVWQRDALLHNGSVPSLEALLTPPDARPVTFERHGFTLDTTVRGNSNQGHGWGTDLGDADKADLIAYLRSL